MQTRAILLTFKPNARPNITGWKTRSISWPCKTPVEADEEVFLVRIGSKLPRGIVGHGRSVSPASGSPRAVNVRFDVLEPNGDPIIPFADMDIGPRTLAFSGVIAVPSLADLLRQRWNTVKPATFPLPPIDHSDTAPPPPRGTRPDRVEFAMEVKRQFDYVCALTGLSELFSECAHIKPHSESSVAERRDPDNGILLAAHLHRAFDRYLFTIDPKGRVIWSNALDRNDRNLLSRHLLRTNISLSEGARRYFESRYKTFQRREAARRSRKGD
jgi:HNH endonuclease